MRDDLLSEALGWLVTAWVMGGGATLVWCLFVLLGPKRTNAIARRVFR